MNGIEQLENAINNCDGVDLDMAFLILQSRKHGIRRKIRCFARVFHVKEDILLDSFPKSSENRLLDKKSREIIYKLLIQRMSK